MTLVLALSAAVAYGLSDFVGGLTSRRVSPWTMALVSMLGGAVAAGVVTLVHGGDPDGADLAWAVLAGLGNGLGTAFLYRGLSGGRMGVVAPVSGVGAALVPVAAGLLAGERPAVLAWVGILVALPAIWLVAREPGAGTGALRGSGLVDGVLAGAGFGVLFAALAQIPEEAGFGPLALNQAVGGVVVVVVAAAMRAPVVPRQPLAALGLVTGLLGLTATGLFLLATHGGLLTLVAVVTSLYPAVTVLLAAGLLRERVHRDQGLGLAMCALAVGLIAAA